MKSINLYMDESGNLGNGMGRYFLICALEVRNDEAKSLGKRAGRVINRFKIHYNISKSTEIKGWKLSDEQRKELISSILFKGINVRYIVLDLKQTTMLLRKADDKNACFNYLVQLIVKRLLQDYPSLEKVTLYLDNRSVKIGNRLSLKPYLYNKLVLEKLEKTTNVKRIEFETNYMESESCYLIEWADILANALYKKYNSNINNYYRMIKPYIVFESKFPSKSFGKENNDKKLTQKQ
ncbi:MAG: DUF3800 domain-containing protein [Ruminococcus sp.]|nr:DUF3800 domain-containing protein [Ruminococcus sp.]